ncbi:MAG TPA: thioredoxin family protein, partial [Pyrinomonadaceae bacterium]
AADTPDAKAAVAIGAVVPDFTLPDADGREHTLASLKGKSGTVIIFIATKCPVSNAYNARMAKLAEDYRAKGVNVVGINSNSTEPAAEVKQHAAEKGLTFTILKDAGHAVADRFGAQVTPEAYLLDASGKLVYHGRIDNSRNGDAITSSELRDAVEAVLAGKAVAKQEVKAFGCSIKRG